LCGIKWQVIGAQYKPSGKAIVAAKHQSAWETLVLQVIFDNALVWVLKRELLWLPFFGWAMALLRPIAIDRSAGRKAVKQVTEQGTHNLQSGESVVIFPEGTRIAPGERGRYGMGGALLAEKAGFPVIPVAHNAGQFWRRNAFRKYPGTIKVVVGPLISVEGKSAAQIRNEVEEWIETTMQRISS
jgi:1-acyl-sn-glycerol-3-phosphate acyltransferase